MQVLWGSWDLGYPEEVRGEDRVTSAPAEARAGLPKVQGPGQDGTGLAYVLWISDI